MEVTFFPWLKKPMNDDTRRGIAEAIINGFDKDFSPVLTIKSLDVEPNYIKKTWKISLSVLSPELLIKLDTEIELK
jgi:hypothetical protein